MLQSIDSYDWNQLYIKLVTLLKPETIQDYYEYSSISLIH